MINAIKEIKTRLKEGGDMVDMSVGSKYMQFRFNIDYDDINIFADCITFDLGDRGKFEIRKDSLEELVKLEEFDYIIYKFILKGDMVLSFVI